MRCINDSWITFSMPLKQYWFVFNARTVMPTLMNCNLESHLVTKIGHVLRSFYHRGTLHNKSQPCSTAYYKLLLFCQIFEELQCEFTFRSKDNWGSPFVPSFWRTFPTLLPAAATSVSTTASHISKTENQWLRLSQSKRDTEKSTSDQNQAWQNPLTCNSGKFVKIWVLTTSFTSWLFLHPRI